MTFKPWVISVFCISILLPGISYAQNKVVVIPLVDEKLVQQQYPCLGPDEVMSNGRCWKDRNLGASRAATSLTDEAAYGDLYQWGRTSDGHQNYSSSTTFALSPNDVPGHGDFILVNSSPNDWRDPQNDILWQGLGGVNNPCPQGFRLPTIGEWTRERDSWSSDDPEGAFASPLKLSLAGSRSRIDGTIQSAGTYGHYWSSSVIGSYAWELFFFGDDSVGYGSPDRARGLSIRCIKD